MANYAARVITRPTRSQSQALIKQPHPLVFTTAPTPPTSGTLVYRARKV